MLTDVTHVNGWEPAVSISYVSHNFRLFHVSNLSIRNFRFFLLMCPGSLSALQSRSSLCSAQRNGATGSGRGGGPPRASHRQSGPYRPGRSDGGSRRRPTHYITSRRRAARDGREGRGRKERFHGAQELSMGGGAWPHWRLAAAQAVQIAPDGCGRGWGEASAST